MALIFLLIGIIVGFVIIQYVLHPKNQILYCRERDGRGVELKVGMEDAISLETRSSPEMRFFKFGRSYEFSHRGRRFTRFFGKEGTAYTWRLQGFEETEESPRQQELNFPTLEAAVKHKWGKNVYEQVPEEQQVELRNNKVLLTVNLEPGLTPKDYKPISESIIHKKAHDDMSELIARRAKGAIQKSPIEWIPWLLAGAGIMAVASKFLGWW